MMEGLSSRKIQFLRIFAFFCFFLKKSVRKTQKQAVGLQKEGF